MGSIVLLKGSCFIHIRVGVYIYISQSYSDSLNVLALLLVNSFFVIAGDCLDCIDSVVVVKKDLQCSYVSSLRFGSSQNDIFVCLFLAGLLKQNNLPNVY